MGTVGLHEATIAKYIREQEKADPITDKLTMKEYTDPFKGSTAKVICYLYERQ